MASQIQLVMYEGFLGADPEMRYTPNGKPVTNFRMASNRQYKTADGKEVKEVTWLKVAAWGKLGEIVNQYCKKGSHVIVRGILRGNKDGSPVVFETKDGGHGANFEISADEVRILNSKDAPNGSPTADEDESPFD